MSIAVTQAPRWASSRVLCPSPQPMFNPDSPFTSGARCLSVTKIYNVLQNPGVRQLFVVTKRHEEIFAIFLPEVIANHVRSWALAFRPDIGNLVRQHEPIPILTKPTR